jgi:hypothetical protein
VRRNDAPSHQQRMKKQLVTEYGKIPITAQVASSD